MRAWLDILHERHPDVAWVTVRPKRPPGNVAEDTLLDLD